MILSPRRVQQLKKGSMVQYREERKDGNGFFKETICALFPEDAKLCFCTTGVLWGVIFCGKNGKGEDAGVGDRIYEQEREKGRELSPKNSLRRRSRSKGRKGKR